MPDTRLKRRVARYHRGGCVRSAVHGMSRIGERRALKWALEAYWARRSDSEALEEVAAAVRRDNWRRMGELGVDFVPSNDFSLYDHVLDAVVALGALPERFHTEDPVDLDRYFAMARGGDLGAGPLAPLELTKWFDTNYHHLVPEVGPATSFRPDASKARHELIEADALGITTTPAFLGPLTFLLRSAPSEAGFRPIELLDALIETYIEVLAELAREGTDWVRFDEPALVEDRTPEELAAFRRAYERLGQTSSRPKIWVATYFGHVGDAMATLCDLPIEGVGLDFCAGAENTELLTDLGGFAGRTLFAGVVDGRNVWRNDLDASLDLLEALESHCAELVVSTSCSLLHLPRSLGADDGIDAEVRPWLAFGQEKLVELSILARGAEDGRASVADALEESRQARAARAGSPRVTVPVIRQATATAPSDPRRAAPGAERLALQRSALGLPMLPVTTIGSFPQTRELRAVRAAWRDGAMSDEDYRAALRAEMDRAVELQEKLGVDVVVHGEPERDDMVRYFAAQMSGFVLPDEGWVQSYGSRCVRPPILFGDVSRPEPITLSWARYAQSLTEKPVKAMLTGPVTMSRWSYVRDDQPLAETAAQLGLAVRDEVADLEAGGLRVIQIDEPALREGMPLRRSERSAYLAWATRAVRLASSAAAPTTQVHTHMCYAELADVVGILDDLEVDVVSFEAARSRMALLSALSGAAYGGDLGPGTYDVHSPAVPSAEVIASRLRGALGALGPERLWVNPDCGLKTRSYAEVTAALANMVAAARRLRAELSSIHYSANPTARASSQRNEQTWGRQGERSTKAQ